jgi:hypothetical protein
MDANIGLIGGCGSSGTTLLAHLLDGIGDLRCSPEAYVFHHERLYAHDLDFKRELYRALAQLGPRLTLDVLGLKHTLVDPIFISSRDFFGLKTVYDEYDLFAAVDSFAGLAEHLMANMVRRHGFPDPFVWVDQTPKNVLTARLFLEALPSAKFIHLLRDGRDVVASLARRYASELPGGTRAAYVHVGALRWCYDVSRGLKARGLPGYLEVRYEDLTADPVHWINVILAHLGRAPIDAAGLRAKRSYAAEHFPLQFLGGNKPTWSASPLEAVTTRSVGKWRTDLSSDEQALLGTLEFQVAGVAQPLCFDRLLAALNYA